MSPMSWYAPASRGSLQRSVSEKNIQVRTYTGSAEARLRLNGRAASRSEKAPFEKHGRSRLLFEVGNPFAPFADRGVRVADLLRRGTRAFGLPISQTSDLYEGI